MNLVTFNLYSHWACALINNDESGMTDEEIAEMNATLEKITAQYPGAYCVGCDGEGDFSRPDFSGLAGDVCQFTFAYPDTQAKTRDEVLHNWHAAELQYIQKLNPKNPGSAFSDSPECFARYCNMQANTAEKDGFPLIAHDMRQARDIAMPDFRSTMRAAGWTIDGERATPPEL